MIYFITGEAVDPNHNTGAVIFQEEFLLAAHKLALRNDLCFSTASAPIKYFPRDGPPTLYNYKDTKN